MKVGDNIIVYYYDQLMFGVVSRNPYTYRPCSMLGRKKTKITIELKGQSRHNENGVRVAFYSFEEDNEGSIWSCSFDVELWRVLCNLQEMRAAVASSYSKQYEFEQKILSEIRACR